MYRDTVCDAFQRRYGVDGWYPNRYLDALERGAEVTTKIQESIQMRIANSLAKKTLLSARIHLRPDNDVAVDVEQQEQKQR